MRVTVVGLGKIGLALAGYYASHGHDVRTAVVLDVVVVDTQKQSAGRRHRDRLWHIRDGERLALVDARD